ncbi:endothelin-converting enzyme 1 [Latimeria chalumnae]|uniref:endothelin-converting enzyme 1 n=1 Tax=Latimeria chalumnae TaxID=7897 RepID=UPI00313AB01E
MNHLQHSQVPSEGQNRTLGTRSVQRGKASKPHRLLLLLLLFVALAGIAFSIVFACRQGPTPCLTESCTSLSERIRSSVNSSVDPCEGFFHYACGNRRKNPPDPEGKRQTSVSEELWEQNQLILKRLLERRGSVPGSSAEDKARSFYRSCMNTEKIEALGAAPLQDIITEVGGWAISSSQPKPDFMQTLAALMRDYNTFPLFRAHIAADPQDPKRNIIQIAQAEFHTPMEGQNQTRAAYTMSLRSYLNYLSRLSLLLGEDENNTAPLIPPMFTFESKLSVLAKAQEEGNSGASQSLRLPLEELQSLAPSIDWLACLTTTFHPLQLNKSDPVLVQDLEYIKKMSELVQGWPRSFFVHYYLIFSLVHNIVPFLDTRFQNATLQWMEEASSGANNLLSPKYDLQETVFPRWKKCVHETRVVFASVLEAMFVHEVFKEETREMAEEMIGEIKTALQTLLEKKEWMDHQTRRVAKDVVNTVQIQVGFTKKLLDRAELETKYRDYEVNEDTYLENIINFFKISRNDSPISFRQLTQKANQWEVSPTSVHPHYLPHSKRIILPAGMFRPPWFHREFPRAVNFGGLGVLLACQAFQAFYDQIMNRANCSDCIQTELMRVGQCLGEQSLNSFHISQEFLKDSGGLSAAYQAYWSLTKSKPDETLPLIEMTPHQLFFLRHAQMVCGEESQEMPQDIRRQTRVDVPLSHSKEFSRHYGCPSGSRMNPRQKCSLW